MVVDSSLGQMMNIATSYGTIVDNAEKEDPNNTKPLSNEAYAELLTDLKIDDIESAYCILLNKSGIITYHSDPSMVGKPNKIPFIRDLAASIGKGIIPENLSASFEQDGKLVYCSYYLTDIKSILFVCADSEELMSPLKTFITQALMVVVGVLVVGGALG